MCDWIKFGPLLNMLLFQKNFQFSALKKTDDRMTSNMAAPKKKSVVT